MCTGHVISVGRCWELRVFGGKRVMHTKFALKHGGAHLGGEVGSVNVLSVLHKKGIINWVTVISAFIVCASQLHIHINV
jgi:hypothetical protein